MYTVRKHKSGKWALFFGEHAAGVDLFRSAKDAKHFAWTALGVMPAIHRPDTIPLDVALPLHRALLAIEDRNSAYRIVSVSPTHYFVQRNATGEEMPVKYDVKNGTVTARNDSELLA